MVTIRGDQVEGIFDDLCDDIRALVSFGECALHVAHPPVQVVVLGFAHIECPFT